MFNIFPLPYLSRKYCLIIKIISLLKERSFNSASKRNFSSNSIGNLTEVEKSAFCSLTVVFILTYSFDYDII